MNIGKNLKNMLKDAACEPEKVMYSIVNNKGYGGFRTMNIVNTKNNSLNIVPRKNIKLTEKKGLGFIGKGEFGTVFMGCINSKCKKQVAVKIQSKKSLLKHEYEILKKIYDITPHITIPYLYKDCGKYSSLYTEYANGGDFENLFKKYQHVLKPIHIQTLIFQVIITIYAIQEQYPSFRHFDLHPGNVFLDTNFPKVGGTKYITGRSVSHNFKVPNIGIRSLIGDFGLASIVNDESANVKSLEFRNNYGVGPNTNKLYDLHFLLGNLYEITKRANLPNTKKFRTFVEEVLPESYLEEMSSKVTKGRLRYDVNHVLPTPSKLLENMYFRTFRMFAKNFTGSNITNVFPKKHNANKFKELQANLKSPGKRKRVVQRALVNNVQVNNSNKQRILNALKAMVASPKRMSPKRMSPKRMSPKRMSPKRMSPKKASPKRMSPMKVAILKLLGKKVSPKSKANEFNFKNVVQVEQVMRSPIRYNMKPMPLMKPLVVKKQKPRKAGEFEIASVNPFLAPKLVVKPQFIGPSPNLMKAKVAELKAFIQDANVQVVKPSVQVKKVNSSGISTLKLWQIYKKKIAENYYNKMSKNSNLSYQNKMNEAGAYAAKIIRNKQKAGEEPPQYVSK